MNGQGDVVRAYVDAFRAKGLLPGLYYSIWDITHPVGGIEQDSTPVTRRAAQLRQDAAHRAADQLRPDPDPDLRRLVAGRWATAGPLPGDPRAGEVAAAGLPAARPHATSSTRGRSTSRTSRSRRARVRPRDNTYPADQEQKINAARRQRLVLGAQRRRPDERRAIVDQPPQVLEPRWTNFLLNCPPNRDGLLDADDRHAARRGGRGVERPTRRAPPLPAQGAADRLPVHAGRRDRDQRQRRQRHRRQERRNYRTRDLAVVGRAAPVDHDRSRRRQARRRRARLRPALRRARRSDHRRRDHVVRRS